MKRNRVSMQKFEQLPIMPVESVPEWSNITVCGNVPTKTKFEAEDLLNMPKARVSGDFFCNDGWVAKELLWEGILITKLLSEAGVDPETLKSVEFKSDDHSRILGVREACEPGVIVATTLNGRALESGNGGPIRLIAGGRSGDYHVKWLKRIHVS
jgi:DMSO/TMAO reductase YedYZ molybdopterin-dependent catalytic subunit